MRKELKSLNKKKIAKKIQRAIEIIEDITEYDFYKDKKFQKDLEDVLFKLSAIQDAILS